VLHGFTAVQIQQPLMVDYTHDLAAIRPAINPIVDDMGSYTGPSNYLIQYSYRPHPLGLNTEGVTSGQSLFIVGYPANSPVAETTSGVVSAPLRIEELLVAQRRVTTQTTTQIPICSE
jgi:hypothetical protein